MSCTIPTMICQLMQIEKGRHTVRCFWPLEEEFLAQFPRKHLGIAYCDTSPLNVLDLYLPEPGSSPAPLIVFTHGGAFANGDQRETQTKPILAALNRGYAVASVQYRRSREALFPAQLYDVKAAVRWLRAHAAEYSLDPHKFASWGPSSGGWLASMLGCTAGNPAFEDPAQGNAGTDSAVQAVVDWCGPCGGWLEMDPAFEKSGLGTPNHSAPDSPESKFLGRCIRDVPELVRLACPCSYVNAAMPPVYILHGGADQVVPVEQSLDFARAVANAAGPERVELHIVPGKLHHGDPWYNEPWVTQEALDFLDKHLR